MQRRVLVGLMLVLAGLMTACSWTTLFVITNGSDVPLRISYSVARDVGRPQCPLTLEPPETAPASDVHGATWTSVPSSDFVLDESACSIAMTLPPRTSVQIAWASCYSRHDVSNPETANLARYRLTLSAPSGDLSCSGMELVRRFKRRSDGLFELEYEPPEFAWK